MSDAVVAVSSMHRLLVLLLALERSYNTNSPGDHCQKLLAYICVFCLILVVTTIQGWCLFCSELSIMLLFEGGVHLKKYSRLRVVQVT